jgi:hypothetical protein
MARRYGLLLGLFGWACGTGGPEIPPELLETGNGSAGAYPPGPYLADVGATLEDFLFQGFRDPLAAGFDPARLTPLAMRDFYDPNGSRGVALLLVNTSAVWCQACRVEHRTLPARQAEFGPRGLVVFSALFQDSDREPATIADLIAWTEQFQIDFPMGLDPEFQLGRYASAETAPLNLIVDTRDMTIVERFVGFQESLLWSRIDSELRARGR